MSTQENRGENDIAMDGKGGRMEVGLRKGIRAFFDLDGITISFWGSTWTGREIVTVEERVVSDKRSFRIKTLHRFEHGGIHYKLVFHVASTVRGDFRIELYRNGELVDSDRFRQSDLGVDPETGRFSAWRLARKLAPYFALGMLFGASVALLVDYLTGG